MSHSAVSLFHHQPKPAVVAVTSEPPPPEMLYSIEDYTNEVPVVIAMDYENKHLDVSITTASDGIVAKQWPKIAEIIANSIRKKRNVTTVTLSGSIPDFLLIPPDKYPDDYTSEEIYVISNTRSIRALHRRADRISVLTDKDKEDLQQLRDQINKQAQEEWKKYKKRNGLTSPETLHALEILCIQEDSLVPITTRREHLLLRATFEEIKVRQAIARLTQEQESTHSRIFWTTLGSAAVDAFAVGFNMGMTVASFTAPLGPFAPAIGAAVGLTFGLIYWIGKSISNKIKNDRVYNQINHTLREPGEVHPIKQNSLLTPALSAFMAVLGWGAAAATGATISANPLTVIHESAANFGFFLVAGIALMTASMELSRYADTQSSKMEKLLVRAREISFRREINNLFSKFLISELLNVNAEELAKFATIARKFWDTEDRLFKLEDALAHDKAALAKIQSPTSTWNNVAELDKSVKTKGEQIKIEQQRLGELQLDFQNFIIRALPNRIADLEAQEQSPATSESNKATISEARQFAQRLLDEIKKNKLTAAREAEVNNQFQTRIKAIEEAITNKNHEGLSLLEIEITSSLQNYRRSVKSYAVVVGVMIGLTIATSLVASVVGILAVIGGVQTGFAALAGTPGVGWGILAIGAIFSVLSGGLVGWKAYHAYKDKYKQKEAELLGEEPKHKGQSSLIGAIDTASSVLAQQATPPAGSGFVSLLVGGIASVVARLVKKIFKKAFYKPKEEDLAEKLGRLRAEVNSQIGLRKSREAATELPIPGHEVVKAEGSRNELSASPQPDAAEPQPSSLAR